MISELKARIEQKKRIDAEVFRLFNIFKTNCKFHVTAPNESYRGNWDKCSNPDDPLISYYPYGLTCNIKNCILLRER